MKKQLFSLFILLGLVLGSASSAVAMERWEDKSNQFEEKAKQKKQKIEALKMKSLPSEVNKVKKIQKRVEEIDELKAKLKKVRRKIGVEWYRGEDSEFFKKLCNSEDLLKEKLHNAKVALFLDMIKDNYDSEMAYVLSDLTWEDLNWEYLYPDFKSNNLFSSQFNTSMLSFL